jgi:hypothetical protein
MISDNDLKDFEDNFERCLNDYWFNLTTTEKKRYIDEYFSPNENYYKDY